MRLLLDEHYAKEIAAQLRDRGHDAVSVTEQPDLMGLADEDLFREASSERRALLTENWADFQREVRKAELIGEAHYGVVFSSRKQLPRGKATIGLYVETLDDFLSRHPAEDALLNSYRWLPDKPLGSGA